MGVAKNVDFKKFPKQGGILGMRVEVCFRYDTRNTIGGEVIRDDIEEPWETIFKLDDGRIVRAAECQYTVPTYVR